MQNIFLKTITAVANLTNNCLEVDKKNTLNYSKDIVIKAIDAVILLERVNLRVNFEKTGANKKYSIRSL